MKRFFLFAFTVLSISGYVDAQTVTFHTVKLQLDSTGTSGNVQGPEGTSGNPYIFCGPNFNGPCQATLPAGMDISLEAKIIQPSTIFKKWVSSDSSAASCNGSTQLVCRFKLNGETTVGAVFEKLPPVNLTILATKTTGNGVVRAKDPTSGVGFLTCTLQQSSIGPSPCTRQFESGKQFILTGDPDNGNTFNGWSSGTGSAQACTGRGTCTFTLTKDTTIRAGFNKIVFQ